jgi:hypothetical protein
VADLALYTQGFRRTFVKSNRTKNEILSIMKYPVVLFPAILPAIIFFLACNRSPAPYKPGMGELMSSIQLHHAKLWFAGENNNWPLAAYNQSLITNNFKRIQLYHGGTFEAKAAYMIDPAMDSLRNAIVRKDRLAFEISFRFLTTSCNNCHIVTRHAFNVITTPTIAPIGNQDFSLSAPRTLESIKY